MSLLHLGVDRRPQESGGQVDPARRRVTHLPNRASGRRVTTEAVGSLSRPGHAPEHGDDRRRTNKIRHDREYRRSMHVSEHVFDIERDTHDTPIKVVQMFENDRSHLYGQGQPATVAP